MATFHPFIRLPYELRTQIWEMTVEPRTASIQSRSSSFYRRYRSWFKYLRPAPAVLQVCREARNLGLYKKAFIPEYPAPIEGLRYVWANFEIDIIDNGEAPFHDYKSIAHTIRRLKFTREESYEYYYYCEVNEIRTFVHVEEIHIVCQDGLFSWIGALEEHYWPCGEENVFFIDPDDEDRVFRGDEGLDTIADLCEQLVEENDKERERQECELRLTHFFELPFIVAEEI